MRWPQPRDRSPGWPYAVLQLMQDKLDFNAALAAAQSDGQARRELDRIGTH
ncbi:MAG: hypothetical protein ABW005_00710 [Burkholderiaceae bacterium]